MREQRMMHTTQLGSSRPGAGRGVARQPNDLGDPILNSDRDVTVTAIRHTYGKLDDAMAPIPPPSEPNDSNYAQDPASRHSD